MGYLIITAFIMGLFGRYVAKEKGRSQTEGFLFGFFLSIVGIIILSLLPTKDNFINENSNDNESGDIILFFVVFGIIALFIILWNSI